MAHAATETKDRRGAISAALYRCIREKGFARTTLKDIAEEAGMSPSHVSYYFENKGAVLLHYAEFICRRNVLDLPDLSERDTRRLIDEIATFCLGDGRMSMGLLGVFQELIGLSVHDSRLHQIKVEHVTAWHEFLVSFFDRCERARGLSSNEAAHLAYATLTGLNTNIFFDRTLDRDTAHRLFRDSLYSLAGLRPRASGHVRLAKRKTKRSEKK